ncbi:MAG: beta-propeller fold lactonase family protein [Mariprofundus sp.]|nr:beta-propeller fold lactonase family protein [Mariprofundus sp.]
MNSSIDNVSTITNTVSGFVINQTTGVLSAMPGSPFSTAGLGNTGFFARNNITLSRSRNLLFASNSGDNNIAVFSIDPVTGGLTVVAGSPFPNSTGATMSGAGSAVVNQSGTLLFVGNRLTFNISVFSIAANGVLTGVIGSPFSAIHSNGVATFSGRMDGLRLNDRGNILYGAASSAVLGVAAFSIAANGALTPLQGSPFTGAVRGPTSFDLDAASGIAIGAGTGGKLTSYNIAVGGALTAIAQTSTASNQFIVNQPGGQQCGEFSPDGSKYITSGGGTAKIAVVNVGATGQLSDAPGSSFTTIHPATGYSAIHPNGLWVYATEKSATANFVEFFNMAANGVLTSQQIILAGARGSHNGVVIY